MFCAVDEALRALLEQELARRPAGAPLIRFGLPAEQGARAALVPPLVAGTQEGSSPEEIFLHLYQISENIECRGHGRFVDRKTGEDSATIKGPAVRMDLRYAVCARAGSPAREHSLLAAAATALLRRPLLDMFDPELDVIGRLGLGNDDVRALLALRDRSPFPVQVAPPGGESDAGQFWQVSARHARAWFGLIVTATLEPYAPKTKEVVTHSLVGLGEDPNRGVAPHVAHRVSIAGTVSERQATGNRPVAGARVELPEFDRATVTDEQGFYYFLNLRAGTYRVRATAPGKTSGEKIVEVAGPAGTEYANADFVLLSPALVGTVRQAGGRPVKGAIVLAAGRQAVSDSEGYFAFETLLSGEHRVEARAAGYVCSSAEIWIRSEAGTEPPRVEITALTAALSGTVLDANGRGIPGARVRVDGEEECRTDAGGRYTIEHISAGQHRIAAEAEQYARAEQYVTLRDPVRGGPGAVLEFRLEHEEADTVTASVERAV